MEIEIVIPENWHEVTLSKYLNFQKAIKAYEGEEQFANKIIDQAVFYICGVGADVLHKMPAETFMTIQQAVVKLISSPKNEVLVRSFELGDRKYGFIPSLDDISYGEYVDLVELSKDTWGNIAEMLSILYRPITKESGDKYQIAEYTSTHPDQVQLFQDKLTMDIVFGAISFFLRLQTDLLKGTLAYSMLNPMKTKMTKEERLQISKALTESGVSIQQLQYWLTTILQNLTSSPN